MNLILKALAAFIIALSGLIMCRGWISVFSQNPSFINSLMSLFQQNLDIVSLIVLILSFLCTIFLRFSPRLDNILLKDWCKSL